MAIKNNNIPLLIACINVVLLFVYIPVALSQSPPPFSYGAVTSSVQRGKTTQSDIVEWWGGPNITTTDRDGTETWVYEKKSSDTDVSYDRNTKAEAQTTTKGGFLNLGIVAAGQVQTQEKAEVQERGGHKTTTSVKTLTVIFKFDKNKIVKDFSTRQASF